MLSKIVLGLNQFDAQALMQMQQQQQQQQSNRYNKLQQAQYSFDDQQLSGSYYDGGMVNPAHANRLNMLQQAQRHSFNMDLLNSTNPGNDYTNQQQQLELMQHQQQQQHQFFTNKRPPGLRNQPISDVSIEELNADFSSLSPQQQQHVLMLRNQQFLNNNNVEPVNAAEVTAATAAPEPAIDYTKLEPMKPPRRKSLPSIVKKQLKEDETAHSSAELNNKYQETYIIENGIKKRVIETHNSAARTNADADSTLDDEHGMHKRRIQVNYEDDQTPQLPRKIVIESIGDLSGGAASTVSKRVSMPSIPAYLSPDLAKKGLVHKFDFVLFAIAFILFCCCCSDAARGGQQAELAAPRRDQKESWARKQHGTAPQDNAESNYFSFSLCFHFFFFWFEMTKCFNKEWYLN